MNKKVIFVKNLNVVFDTSEGIVNVLNGVQFELEDNEVVAIVGESGSGKSVFSKSLIGLLPENAKITIGEIIYTDKNKNDINLRTISDNKYEKIRGREIAMIFQDPMTALNPVIKIGKQIQETIIKNSNKGISRHQAKELTFDLLQDMGINNPKQSYHYYPHQFSGGMRQRVVIAIALACNPKVLIADEPTTALDVTVQAQILQLIKKLQRKRKISVIFITHDLGIVAHIANKVNVMYAGEIIEKGLVEEIFYSPKHPYTWGLLSSVPHLENKNNKLYSIPGSPPKLLNNNIKGDPFAPRNKWALNIDWIKKPPLFKITDTHYAKTWLLDKRAPKVNFNYKVNDKNN